MEKQLEQLIEELGEVINSSLSDSERFAAVMAEMEQAGYNVFVVLEASIGFKKNGEPDSEAGAAGIHVSPQPKYDSVGNTELTDDDLAFLRDLKISAS